MRHHAIVHLPLTYTYVTLLVWLEKTGRLRCLLGAANSVLLILVNTHYLRGSRNLFKNRFASRQYGLAFIRELGFSLRPYDT